MNLLDQLIFASENSTDAVLITDAQIDLPGPNVVYCNERFTQATGYTLADFKGKSPRILQGPGSNITVLKELRNALNEERNFRGRSINYHKNGTPLEVEWSIIPVYDENTRVAYYFSSQQYLIFSGSNETHLRHLARGLLDMQDDSFFEDICRKIVEHACVDFAAIIQTEGEQSHILGVSSVNENEETEAFVLEPAVRKRLAGGALTVTQDTEWLGSCPWLSGFLDAQELRSLKLFPIAATEQPSSLLVIGHRVDLSGQLPIDDLLQLSSARLQIEFELIARQREIAMLQNQLFEAHKMELVGRLSSGVAHEFNNLITSIQGYTNGVLESADLSQQERDDLNKVVAATHTASEVTSRLLFMGRRNLSCTEELNPTRLRQLEESVHRAAGKEMKLVFDIEETELVIIGTNDAVRQILVNLCLNAHDASQKGDTIKVTGKVENESYVVEVQDSGLGMSPETLDRAFDPFFSTKSLGKSIGLGLSTVHGLVKQMNGTIRIHSDLGAGTTVTLKFPLVAPTEKVATAMPELDLTEGPPRRILIVEDNDGIRQLAARVLRKANYIVETYTSAEEVLSSTEEHGWNFDLVLTDVLMGEMTGIELSRKVHQARPDIPVIFMTGFSEEVLINEQIIAETSLIMKPFQAEELRTAVRRAIVKPTHLVLEESVPVDGSGNL